MKKKNKILGIAGGLLFIAFVAMNFTASRSYQGDESVAQLTMTELVAKAQSGEGCLQWGDCLGDNDCFVVQVTPQSIYNYAVALHNCRPSCSTGGTACCPVELFKTCCCAR